MKLAHNRLLFNLGTVLAVTAWYCSFPEHMLVKVSMNSSDGPPAKRVMSAYNSAFPENPK